MLYVLHIIGVSDLKDLVTTAEQSQFPDCDLLQLLKSTLAEAERCASVALQLVSRKHRTRQNLPTSLVHGPKLGLDELQAFNQQLESLPCLIREAELVQVCCKEIPSAHMCNHLNIDLRWQVILLSSNKSFSSATTSNSE